MFKIYSLLMIILLFLLICLLPVMAENTKYLEMDTNLMTKSGHVAKFSGGTYVILDEEELVFRGMLAEDTTFMTRSGHAAKFSVGSYIELDEKGLLFSGMLAEDTTFMTRSGHAVNFSAGGYVEFDEEGFVFYGMLASDTTFKTKSGQSLNFSAGTYIELDKEGMISSDTDREDTTGYSFKGKWWGDSGDGKFREIWFIDCINGEWKVYGKYYSDGEEKGGFDGDIDSYKDGKLYFKQVFFKLPDPTWSSINNIEAWVEGDVLIFNWNTGSDNGQVRLKKY